MKQNRDLKLLLNLNQLSYKLVDATLWMNYETLLLLKIVDFTNMNLAIK